MASVLGGFQTARTPLVAKLSVFSSSALPSFSCNPNSLNNPLRSAAGVLRWGKSKEDQDLLQGLPQEYYDDEWQARQREKTKELHQRRQEEDEAEERKVEEYREIGLRLKGFPEEDVKKARRLVSTFMRAAEEVEEIEEAAEKGELDELVLFVIWNRLDLARRDDEKDAIRSLDLLYRRVEECKKRMIAAFPREDPFSILIPPSFDINERHGPDDVLLRVDFVREVDALLREVRAEQAKDEQAQGLDPESVATRLKQQEKQRTVHLVEKLLDLAINMVW
ncbi:hypothetical protein Dimus_003694 [Dionaea muscipula]